MRIERDPLGSLPVPARVYYGIQTRRAMLNFPISGRRLPPVFIRAYAHVKLAAATVNRSLGLLDGRRAAAIRRAAAEIVAGRHLDQFVVDVYQAGAGTSQNMNLNEVIANRAIEILGGRLGDYARVHPNDHVNMSQSTNDTFPSALRLALLFSLPGLRRSLLECETALRILGRKLGRTVKSARTHLQDAVPIMLGQEFGAYASMLRRARTRVEESGAPLRRLNLGATAAGTGLNAHPRYAGRVARQLSRQTGLRLRPATDLVEIATPFLYLQLNGNPQSQLQVSRATPAEMDLFKASSDTQSNPCWWSLDALRLTLWPVPITSADVLTGRYMTDLGVPTMRWNGTSYDFQTPDGRGLTGDFANDWFTSCEMLVRARASYLLAVTLHDPQADTFQMRWLEEKAKIEEESDARGGAMRIVPHLI